MFSLRRLFILGAVGKALSPPWVGRVGPALNSFSSSHGQSAKKALRAVQRFVSPPTWTGPRTGFSFTLPRIHVRKTFPSGDRAFSGPSAARIEIPRARGVEIKAFLTRGRQKTP